jgi:hypothetical protein
MNKKNQEREYVKIYVCNAFCCLFHDNDNDNDGWLLLMMLGLVDGDGSNLPSCAV